MINLFANETLKNLAEKISNLFHLEETDGAVDTETGEYLDQAALDALDAAYEDKVNGIIAYIKDLRANAKAHKEEAKNQAAMAKSEEKRADLLSGYLQKYLNGKKWESPVGKVSYRRTTSVALGVDVDGLPKQFVREKVTRSADLVALKKALKAGEHVDGVALVEKVSMGVK